MCIAADKANEKYRTSVRKLDRQRLAFEDHVETALKQWYIWELDRLRAVKTVLLQYESMIAGFPKALALSLERSDTLLALLQPESDLSVAIERYRTGPSDLKLTFTRASGMRVLMSSSVSI